MDEPHFFPDAPPAPELATGQARYGSDEAVAQYCDAHYGPDRFGVANFPAQLAKFCSEARGEAPRRRALDLGCAVGRASFELARHFDRVDAIDFSVRFIGLARRLQERGRLCYQLLEEGELHSDQEVRLADLGLQPCAARVAFHRGDAQHLAAQFADYDLILAANLIDRLADPGDFLANVHRRLVPGGLLGIASPYTWLEEFTPRRRWLGGRYRSGAPLTSLQGLSEKLSDHFAAVGAPREVEFVIRETARKYQHSIAQLTFWRRVA